MAERQTARPTEPARFSLERELEPLRSGATRPELPVRGRDELHVCPTCASPLVQPTDWAPADRERWCVALRCPECEWRGGGIYPQRTVDHFDEVLDDAMQAVLDDLQALTRSNMEEQAERFTAALWADRILPVDF